MRVEEWENGLIKENMKTNSVFIISQTKGKEMADSWELDWKTR